MTLRRYLSLLSPHALPLGIAALLLLGTAAIPALVVALVHVAVGALASGDAIGGVAGGLVGLAVLHGTTLVVRTWLTKRVAWRIAGGLRRRVHAAWLYGRPDGVLGDRLARLGDEIDQVQYGVSALVTALRNPLALAGLAAVTGWLAPRAAALGLLLVVPLLLAAGLAGTLVRRRTSALRRSRAAWAGVTAEQLGALETLQALGAEDAEVARFAAVTERDARARLALDVVRTLPGVLVQGLAAAAGGLLLLGSAGGRVGADDAAALIAALALAQRPLGGLAEVWALLQRSLGALERVEEALETPPRVSPPATPRALPDGPLTLRWEDVGLELGGRSILAEVTAEARPGEILAIVGATGAGKTSLLRLGWRGLDPTSGQVFLGGIDLRDIAAPDRHRAIAAAPQDVVLQGRTVRENLTLGLDGISDPALVAALEAAHATFVLERPGGLDAVLAEGARGLSGGERQRLSLARAWVRDARVWLLDEPTSQVDAPTTEALAASLRAARPGRTIIVVAHDPGLVAVADRILHLEGG
ncbi:MAG: ABC transporter ATP-binding protein, partial [Myxococcota bacterium]